LNYHLSDIDTSTVEAFMAGSGIATDEVCNALSDLTIQQLVKRVAHENNSLIIAGVQQGDEEYRELAGNPARTTDFVFWTDDIVRDMLRRAKKVTGQATINPFRLKGPAFEIGSTIRAGRQGPEHLDVVVSDLVRELKKTSSRAKITPIDKRITLPRLLPLAESEGGVAKGYTVISVGEAVADVLTGEDSMTGETSALHLVKRSVGLVIHEGLPPRIKRKLERAELEPKTLGNLLLHTIERPDAEFNGVLPESTVYFVRRPLRSPEPQRK
jgi:hypothetical protein